MNCNFNLKGNIYAERLISEWITHQKIIIALDFDDTVYPWKLLSDDDKNHLNKLVNLLKFATVIGCYISIWSACDPSRNDEILNYCEELGIKVDSINENPIKLPYGNFKKMYYNILLDDRAGLEESMRILEYACYRVAAHKRNEKNISQNFDV